MFDLVAGDSRLTLCPRLGGSIGNWQRRGVPVLRHSSAETLAGGSSRALACFPLIPFSNRIAWGRFSFGGESFQLDRNFGDHPHTIHGNAWQREWSVVSQSAYAAELRLDHDPAADAGHHWPYAYHCTLDYTLGPDTLHVTIRLTNTDGRAQPVGFGLHPYQPRTPQTAIAFRAGSVWHTGADALPDTRLPVDGPPWSFDPGHVITPAPARQLLRRMDGPGGDHPAGARAAADHRGGRPVPPPRGLHAGQQAVFRGRAGEQHDRCGQP